MEYRESYNILIKQLFIITYLILSLKSESQIVRSGFIPININLGDTTQFVFRFNDGIDSFKLSNPHQELDIIDTNFFTINGAANKSSLNNNVISVVLKMRANDTGTFSMTNGKLYCKNKVYEISSSNKLTVQNKDSNSSLLKTINIFDLLTDKKSIPDTIKLKLKQQLNSSKREIIAATDKEQYKIGDIVKLYYITNQNKNPLTIIKLKDKVLNYKSLAQLTESNHSQEKIDYFSILLHEYEVISKGRFNIPLEINIINNSIKIVSYKTIEITE